MQRLIKKNPLKKLSKNLRNVPNSGSKKHKYMLLESEDDVALLSKQKKVYYTKILLLLLI